MKKEICCPLLIKTLSVLAEPPGEPFQPLKTKKSPKYLVEYEPLSPVILNRTLNLPKPLTITNQRLKRSLRITVWNWLL